MSKRFITGTDFEKMVFQGASLLQRNVERVNSLNVFPVPDGDTGTNMNLTMSAGVQELAAKRSELIGKASEVLSKGLLMGARGNSGVILSQLFRGFARGVNGLEQVNTVQFAAALQHGVDTAYKAVVKPVEGTILTVAKEAAKHAMFHARRTADMVELMREIHTKAGEALARTPDLLPILKQVGVVDSGGQGLVYIYQGFLEVLSADGQHDADGVNVAPASIIEAVSAARSNVSATAPVSAQSHLATADIEYLYDMEFFINRKFGSVQQRSFDEAAFKRGLAKDGDSIIVIADEEIIKVHVHSKRPGDVLNLALSYGELTEIHILNMRDQHRELLQDGTVYDESSAVPSGSSVGAVLGASTSDRALAEALPEVLTGTAGQSLPPGEVYELAPYGIISVALGEGIATIFMDNNVDIVLAGGQTMNPSTEDFVQAMSSLQAEHIFLLPNNSNIILAAQQAAELSDRRVTVIPTRSIPQGLAALLAFKDHEAPERNAAFMQQAMEQVKSGQVTHAVRDTEIDDLSIKSGDYIGIQEKTIVASSPDLQQTCRELLTLMLGDSGELVTVLTGDEAPEKVTNGLIDWLKSAYPQVEFEVHEGGQPLYPYLFAVE